MCYALIILGPAAGFAGAGLAMHPLAIPLLYLGSVAYGLSLPLMQETINKRVGSERRATIISAASLAGRIGYVIAGPAIGWIAENAGLRPALGTMSLVLLLGAAITLPMMWHRLGEKEN